jgi:hypothetical protein
MMVPHIIRHVHYQFVDMGGLSTEEAQKAAEVTKLSSDVQRLAKPYILSSPAHCCINRGEETACSRKHSGSVPEFANKGLEGFQRSQFAACLRKAAALAGSRWIVCLMPSKVNPIMSFLLV